MDAILHRTLVIRLSSIGDIVLSTPLLRALRTRFPDARIDYLVREEYADLVRWNPHLSATLTFPRNGGARELLDLRRRLRASGYDLLIDIHDSIRSRILTAGFPAVRIRKRKLARFLLIHARRNWYHRLGGSPPVTERYLETVRHLGVHDDGGGPDLAVPPAAGERARRLYGEAGLAEMTPLVGLAPGARHATKRWPPERFAGAGGDLARSLGGAVALFGSAAERPVADAVRRTLAERHPALPIVDAVGMLSLADTAAALDRCAVVLTNDSGLLHMASARRRPVVAVFGSTVRAFGFAPRGPHSRVVEAAGVECRPCSHIGRDRCPKGHFRCMLDIGEDMVLRAAHDALRETA